MHISDEDGQVEGSFPHFLVAILTARVFFLYLPSNIREVNVKVITLQFLTCP